MQDGGTMDTTNTGNYGRKVDTTGNSGYYEWATVKSKTGQSITLNHALKYKYENQVFSVTNKTVKKQYQIVRVPQFTRWTLTKNYTCAPWNGSSGGIIVAMVQNGITGSATYKINVSGKGFRGGGGVNLTGASGYGINWTYQHSLSTKACNSSKGEGNGGSPRYTWNGTVLADSGSTLEGYLQGSFGRGAAGNAGGGATDGNPNNDNGYNSGGAGGANGGYGGRGGDSWHLFNPQANQHPCGGSGGRIQLKDMDNRIFLGGGGGSGTSNNSTSGTQSNGGCGGGIVMLYADSINGTLRIWSNGLDGTMPSGTDAGGGGGAGGTVMVYKNKGTGLIRINANGGNGGNSGYVCHGPGGGAGGGVIYSNIVPDTQNVYLGVNGLTGFNGSGCSNCAPCVNTAYGSTPGGVGINRSSYNHPLTSVTLTSSCNSLPVEMLSFNGELVSNKTELYWATAMENNSSHYIIERSSDGENFEPIGTVESNHNTNNISKYSFTNANLNNPNLYVLYYRLVNQDYNGEKQYHGVITIKLKRQVQNTFGLNAFPNPFQNALNINVFVEQAGYFNVFLYSSTGVMVQKLNPNFEQGDNILKLSELSSLPSGLYIISVQNQDGDTKLLKLMKN